MDALVIKKQTKNRLAIALTAGLFVCLAGMMAYVFFVLKHDPLLVNLNERLQPANLEHPLGTDHLGRDVLTRLIVGARYTIGYGVLALAIAALIGIPFGLLSGLKGGIIDRLFMRTADAFLAFPDTIVAIVLSGLLGAGIEQLLFAIVMVKWVSYARIVRSTVLTERDKDYMLAAAINGLSTWSIMKKHLFPHVAGHVVVLASLDLGKIILLISALSYIGLGAQPPVPEWGAMLNDARPYFQSAPSLMLYPGLAIAGVVLLSNIAGDYLRDHFDVKKEVKE
ncbi:nickel transporter permease [Domibacillus indicus]|uniref:nickel transporter permease n=1 Tax=Domibacillus indicus TaxID=1437523 RepID=UPI000617ECCE|nr:nickel transporter permease [Domibacillus indicus]